MASPPYDSEDSSDYSDSEDFDLVCEGGRCSYVSRGGGSSSSCSCSGGGCGRPSSGGRSCGSGGCGSGGGGFSSVLPFNPSSIEEILLMIFDKFNFRVLMEERTRGAVLITAGFAIAGGIFGKHVGGNVGAAVGGAVGGVCGIGVVAISMKDAWNDIKYQLSELVELAYDYMAGLELKDYQTAANVLMSNGIISSQLASMLMSQASSSLGKNIISSITNNY